MSHAALVSDGVFWLVIFMTVLLAMFVYAVVVTPLEPADRSAEEPALGPSDCPRPRRSWHCRPGGPRPPRPPLTPPARPAVPAMRPGTPPAAAPVIFAPRAPSGPRRGAKLASILGSPAWSRP
jgi:hypothetical protein